MRKSSWTKGLAAVFDELGLSEDSGVANGYVGQASTKPSADIYDLIADSLVSRCSPSRDESSLLEIGCGTGEILVRLKSAYGQTTGIDISPVMVERAKALGLNVVSYNGGRLPFADGTFDHVIIYQVLVNFPSEKYVEALLTDAWRCIRSGGKLYLGALPHPGRSRFPSHGRLPTLRKSLASTFGRESLSCFAMPMSLIARCAERLNASEINFFPNPVPLSGWESKYDVLVSKKVDLKA